MVTVLYEMNDRAYTLVLENDKWRGGHLGFARVLNEAFEEVVGRCEYYPTDWHKADRIARLLKGQVLEPEPEVESDPNRIY